MSDVTELFPLVQSLTVASEREAALVELSKKRELYPDLAPVLWYSFGVMSALLQEILCNNVYLVMSVWMNL
jgi:CCR4-NOT transcription complex subunit 9